MTPKKKTKKCPTCSETKLLEDFYEGNGECKPCFKLRMKAYRHRTRRKRPDFEASHKREWRKAHPGAHAANNRAWQERNPQKTKAHALVRQAIINGSLIKKPCEVCPSEDAQAHHDDYSQPLNVRWLCQLHHAEHHYQSNLSI